MTCSLLAGLRPLSLLSRIFNSSAKYKFAVAALTFGSICSAAATDFTVVVNDPQSRPVPGANVVVSNPAPIARTTAIDGTAQFADIDDSRNIRVDVAAVGFARASAEYHPKTANGKLVITLKIVAPSQTVSVTATGIPLVTDESATALSEVNASELALLQPFAAADILRVIPGAIVADAGQRGGLTSLFVRGGESRYNKVLVDGVPVNEPGGTFDFGTFPMDQIDRVEMVRGPASALYGSDAMTSVVQVFTRQGTTPVPELRLGADGGNFGTARGYASLSGARGRYDYNLYGDQYNTEGQGINAGYSDSSQGANIGARVTPSTILRFNIRHDNNRTGVQSFYNFNGQELIPPDSDQYARQNNFLSSASLSFKTGSRWQHRINAFEYNHNRTNVDTVMDPGRGTCMIGQIPCPAGDFNGFDYPFSDFADINRAGVEYQGEYVLRSWARSTFGYYFEDENGWVGDKITLTNTHGLRRNQAVYGQEVLTRGRASVIAGLRYEHNESFGDKAIPRVAGSYVIARGRHLLSGTRLRAAYSAGIKAPRFEESFGIGGYNIDPNPNLKPEENRSWEAGVEQVFLDGKMSASATYFNNQFKNQIDFLTLNYTTYESQYINVNKSMSHGAELLLGAQPTSRLRLQGGYTYLSSQILDKPLCGDYCNPLQAPGAPFVRRPKHSGVLSATWVGTRWGANVSGTFVGRRPDSDFMGLMPPVTYAAGYGRLDMGMWRTLTSRVTAYFNVNNVTNRHYEEEAGYPALRTNFRVGMRFRLGGE